MSYLLDKKQRVKKFKRLTLIVFLLFFLLYFRSPVLNGFSSAASFIFRPVAFLGNGIGGGFSNIKTFFSSKKILVLENETLKLTLAENNARMSNYNSILDENLKLKEILNRKVGKNDMVLSNILLKPNRSLYDTFVIDVGSKDGIYVGQRVFAFGNVPIGKVGEAYANTSKVVLFSSPGEKTDVVVSGKDTVMQLIGRGGGNFEMILPRDFVIENGTEVILPGIIPHTIGKVDAILSDPRDPYQKALLVSPVNIFELKFVELEK